MTACLLKEPFMHLDIFTSHSAPAANVETILGCGWFDSSYELQAGLSVQEYRGLDALAPLLDLTDWLALHNSSNLVTPQT
jgi:hypothetical protein